MKKILFGLAAIMFAAVSCDSSFNFGNIDNSMTFLPNATLPFPDGVSKHHDFNSSDFLGLGSDGVTTKTVEQNFSVDLTKLGSGIVLDKNISIAFTDVPDFLTNPKSEIIFEKAPVCVELENPTPDSALKVSAVLTVDGARISQPFEASLEAKRGVQTILFDISKNIKFVPKEVVISNLTLTSQSTKAVAPLASNVTLSLKSFAKFEMRFMPRSKFVFDYSFDDLAFDLSGLSIDARNIVIKAKVAESTFPVSIEGSATDREKDFEAALSKIPPYAKNADVTLSAKCASGLKKITNVQLEMIAVNESSSVVTIDEECSISLDLDTIVLPDGFDVN